MQVIQDIQHIVRQAQQNAYRSINQAMVQAYWLVGKRIVEEEQHGEHKAAYGRGIIKNLSAALQTEFGKGFSGRNLENMRAFYLQYPISQTVSAESQAPEFRLSWSHYQMLLRIENKDERAFYEIEAAQIDLKIGDLQHQDLGQIQMYVNYYDRFVKLEEENKTIGIVLCQDKSEMLVEITLPEDNQQIFASRYQTVLPSKEELQALLTQHLKH